MDGFAGVRQAVVMAREDVPGLVRLVGYYTAVAPVDEVALKAHLAATMPEYMVPTAFAMLESFPLTPNRKVDRKSLPAPQVRTVAAPVAEPSPVIVAPVAIEAPQVEARAATAPAPAGDTFTQASAEAAIAAIWARILGVQGIGARDNFFDLGGHSLLAVQAHREIRADLGVRSLSITDIFRFPVLSALAAKLVGQPMPEGAAAEAVAEVPAPVVEPPPVAAPAPVMAAPAAPVAPSPQPTATAPQIAHPSKDRAGYRTEAMNRRRQLRADRLTRAG